MVLKPTIKALLNAGVLAALLPLTANAAGLGKLTVTSALGQPLRGEIELVAVTKGEAESITARIASPEAFKEARIERLKALQNVQFSVEQRTGGEPYLKVTSSQPIEEPFLDMLIELNWPSGRLLREYTILLDPPGYTQAITVQPVDVPTAKPAAAAAPQAPASPAPEAVPAIAARPVPAAQPERVAPKAGDKAEAAEKTYGPVKKGETLAAIASHVKPEGYSLEQMLVALYQSNRQAFAGSNMNRLKTGQILRVPESSEIGTVGKAEAAHEIKAHAADWNAYRQKLAAAVTESAPAREEAAKQSASGKITTAVEDKAAPPKEPSRDVLKLSKGETGGKEAQALQERIRALQEEATAREKSVKETNERIAALEKNIKDMQQLLAIKDKSLADLQKQAASTKGAPAQPEAPAAKPAEPAKPAPAAEKAPAAAEAQPEVPKAEAPKPAPKPAAKPKPATPPPPPPEPSLVDDMLANPVYLAGGGAAALLVGLLGYMALGHRRKKNLASFEDSIMTGGDLKVNTVLGSTAGAVVDTGDTSFLTDFSQAGMGTIDTNDVDPIAEAEVYMAYGRDAQAEEILKESLTKDPNRHEIHLKLLEIYAGRKNLLAFETLASELYAATGGQGDPIWVKAAEMGRALDPNNPLYASTGAATTARSGGDTIMKGIPVATAAAVAAAGASTLAAEEFDLGRDDTEPAPEDTAPDLGFNLDQELAATMEPDAAESQPPTEEETALSLDFNLAETLAEEPAAEATPAAPAETEAEAPAENVLEFDLGSLFETPAAEPAVAETAAAPVAESAAPPEDTGLVLDFEAALLQPEEAPAEEPPVAAAPSGEPASTSEDLAMDFAIPESTVDELQPLIESEPIVVEAAQAAPDLDFDFEIEATPAPSSTEAPQLQVPELDLGGISLDIGEAPVPATDEAATPADADHQEAATKLDLARAYMEMGDREGAREILGEVRKEGSAQQQEEAGKLLASLD